MKRGKSTGKPTKAEQERLDKLKQMPCLCCRHNSRYSSDYISTGLPVEIHHLVDKGYRSLSGGHMATIPLCSWHHDGRGLYSSPANNEAAFGPWLKQRQAFRETYGTERELLEKVNERLAK